MRLIGLVLAAILTLAPLAAEGQPAERVRVVGVMVGQPEGARAFEEGLRKLGWVEGKTVRFERSVGSDYERLSRFAAELTRIPVDVIYAGNSPATRAAMEATRTLPIITMSADPVAAGFVASLARPGANITGVAIMNTELSGKRLELLVQAAPDSTTDCDARQSGEPGDARDAS